MKSMNVLKQELKSKMVEVRNQLQIEKPHLEEDDLHSELMDIVHDTLSFIDHPEIV